MRFMILIKSDKNAEAGRMPGVAYMAEMTQFNEELLKAGILLGAEGLQPSSKGARVRFSKGKSVVTDGPFAETKELIAGFWIWQVKSKEEAIEWVKRVPMPTPDTEAEIEIRQVFEMDDFGPELTPELREQEERQRAELEKLPQSTSPGCLHPPKKNIFVNLPVKDLNRSVGFFTKLGYTFNPQFTDENATCMIVGENIHVMLLVEKYFKTFTPKPVADAKNSTETLVALSAPSRDEVNRIVEKALAAGARRYKEPLDHGFMYQWGFEDPDGHIWEHFWMDPAAMQK